VSTIVLLASALCASPAFANDCGSLAKLHLHHGKITLAEAIAAGTFTPPLGKPIPNLPAFCRVAAMLTPAADSEIYVEVWLPETTWNERIQGTGNGGFAGSIIYGSLAAGVNQGYATANTDMGMYVPPHSSQSIFIGHPDHWIDWGYRATHEMTLLTKDLVKAYYGRDAKKAYFVGCSTGGEQGMMEAQRFPDDYDGIVAGAPASNRTAVHISLLWNLAVGQTTPGGYLPPAKIELLAKAVLDACDELDGVKDGIVADPQACKFDPAVLQCKSADKEDCLTSAQVKVVRELYEGPTNPRTGENIYPGLAKGGEAMWKDLSTIPGQERGAPYAPIFQWVFGEKWNWRSFDWDHDVDAMNAQLASSVNATNPDLDVFREHGHKLLEYQGWDDTVVGPGEAVKYHDKVVAMTKDKSISNSYRLFMVPGMNHCGGGPGGSLRPSLPEVEKWVEQGIAPDSMIAARAVPSGEGSAPKVTQRLVCPYPSVAHYKGTGSIDSAASYECTKSTVETVTEKLEP
jgi:feruloyl esterase